MRRLRLSKIRYVLAFQHGRYNSKDNFVTGNKYDIGKVGSFKSVNESINKQAMPLAPNRSYPVREYVKKVKMSPRTQKIERVSHDVMSLSIDDIKKKYKKLPIVIYHVLEDANYHTKNNMLTKEGLFGAKTKSVAFMTKEVYYTPNNYSIGNNAFKKYRREGGKSWE